VVREKVAEVVREGENGREDIPVLLFRSPAVVVIPGSFLATSSCAEKGRRSSGQSPFTGQEKEDRNVLPPVMHSSGATTTDGPTEFTLRMIG
jgi:hypothetical protein